MNKIDFKFILKDRKGNDIIEKHEKEEVPVFANELLGTILDNPTEETKDPFKLLKMNKLVNDLFDTGVISIDSEDAVMIKKAVSHFPIKVGLSAQIIEVINSKDFDS